MKKIDQNKPVRLSRPCKGEEKLIFRIKNYNEITGRYLIEPINLPNWNRSVLPVELVSQGEIENVGETDEN